MRCRARAIACVLFALPPAAFAEVVDLVCVSEDGKRFSINATVDTSVPSVEFNGISASRVHVDDGLISFALNLRTGSTGMTSTDRLGC